jgi:hypoxanthine phosphoribosyltransferase
VGRKWRRLPHFDRIVERLGVNMTEVLIPRDAIARRVAELAREIRADAGPDTPVHLVAVLKGAFIFLADLLRAFEGPVTCDFLAVSSYGGGTSSSGQARLTKDLDRPIEGRDVVLVEDIADTGLTLSYIQEMLRNRAPRTLRTVCLLSKPSRRQIDVPVEYIGFEIPDRFVIGYGLDVDERYRNLPDIGVMEGA